MRAAMGKFILLTIGVALTLGCGVTEEKIERWKGTKNGPKKLAGTAIDPEVSIPLRAKAVVALTEIQDRDDEDVWTLFTKTFQKMAKSDAEKVLNLAVPTIAGKMKSSAKGAISKSQVGAKDALFIMIDYAGGKGKIEAEKALINWCVNDYNIRALAGKYNIHAIVKKIGAPAAEALIALLNVNEIAIKFVAELIRDVNDETVLDKASARLADELGKNVNKLQEVHYVSAAIIGREPLASRLLEFAGNPELPPEVQRFGLRAFSEGLTTKRFVINDALIPKLFGIAEDAKLDQYQREETYYVIAQLGRNQDGPQIEKLLKSNEAFWRSVGLRCLLRLDPEGERLAETLMALDRLGLSKNKEDMEAAITRVASFPKLVRKARDLLGDASELVVGIAVNVLATAGTSEDIPALEKLINDRRELPKGFELRTLSKAVEAAIVEIKKRG